MRCIKRGVWRHVPTFPRPPCSLGSYFRRTYTKRWNLANKSLLRTRNLGFVSHGTLRGVAGGTRNRGAPVEVLGTDCGRHTQLLDSRRGRYLVPTMSMMSDGMTALASESEQN